MFEIMLGGGGRLIESGFFSFRIYLFFVLLLITLPVFIKYLIKNQVSKIIIYSFIGYTLVIIIGFIIAKICHNENSLIFIDIKPLSFFYSIMFIYLFIQDKNQIEIIKKIIKFSSLVMAIGYFICFLLLNTGFNWFNYNSFYNFLLPFGEFFFRGSVAFFYKGFFYMCIGLIFWVFDEKKYSKYIATFIFLAIFLTYTRGFLLAFCLAFLIHYILSNSSNFKKIILAILATVIAIFIFSVLLSSSFEYLETRASYKIDKKSLDTKDISNQERIKQIQDVFSEVSYLSIIQGHGYGKGVKSRNIHMEISYLEIFHKQGIIGMAMWISFFILIFKLYLQSLKMKIQKETNPFFVSILFTFIVSLTNPFLNNPLGLSILIITLVYFNLLINKSKKTVL
ncbi:MAG: O-antigen ligase family protein [Bacteroidetes bacterium]|nr:O-antigen ligase family protein [Bacteroidota bacterium]